jgi:mitochondrial fission protein ELM1
MVSQAMGLAEAVGFDIVDKTIRPGAPWKWIPAGLWPPGVAGVAAGSDPIGGTPPDLIVSCGRHAVGPALWLKRQHGARSFLVHVQHPRVDTTRFDLIVAPVHDGLSGPNVIDITGSLHRVTETSMVISIARRMLS